MTRRLLRIYSMRIPVVRRPILHLKLIQFGRHGYSASWSICGLAHWQADGLTFVIVETRTGLRTCTHDFSLFPSFHIMVFVPFPILQLDTPCCSALEQCLVHLWLLVLYFNCIVWFLMDWCTKKERKNIIEMSSHMKTNLDSFQIRASCWTARLPWYNVTFLPFALLGISWETMSYNGHPLLAKGLAFGFCYRICIY